MFSLILAAISVACQMLFWDVSAVAAVESTLWWLWGWHMAFAIFKIVCGLVVTVLAFVGATNAVDTSGEATAVGVMIAMGSPLIMALFMIGSILFLGGVYAIDAGIQGGEVIDQSKVVLGSILYGLGVLMQYNRSRNSSSSGD